jgi:hypothetical protein
VLEQPALAAAELSADQAAAREAAAIPVTNESILLESHTP